MQQNVSIPVVKLLVAAILFVTLPALVFFGVHGMDYIELTSNLKNSTSEAISAISAIITAHIIVAYFLYTAYNIETTKVRVD